MQMDGLHANVVTYNTLIDIHGKLGRWQDAIGVLDLIAEQVLGSRCILLARCFSDALQLERPMENLQSSELCIRHSWPMSLHCSLAVESTMLDILHP